MLDSRMLAAVTAETAMPQSRQTTNEPTSGKSLRWMLKALFCCLSICALLLACAPIAAAQTDMGTVTLGGSTSKSVTVSYTGTSNSVAALTQGAASKDFTVGSTSCTGSPCSVTVTFAPKYSGERLGALVVYDSGGNALGTTYLTGYGSGPQLTFTSNPGHLGSDFIGTTLQGVAVDGAGNAYITDSSTGALYQLSPARTGIESITWSKSTIVNGCGSTATTDCFVSAQSVAVDGAGNLYVTDAGNGGTVSPGVYKLSLQSDGAYSAPAAMPGPSGGWSSPYGIAVDGAGNVFVANNGTEEIFQLTPSGSGYSSPSRIMSGAATGLAADSAGNLYVAGTNHVYKYLSSESYGTEHPVYSSDTDTTVTGVAVDANGNVFISDSVNPIMEATPVSGGVNATTYNTAATLQGDIFTSAALALDGAGNIYAVNAAGQGYAGTLFFYAQLESWGGTGLAAWGTVNPTSTQITNDGNQPLTLSGVDTSAAPDFQFVQTGTAFTNLCTTSTPLAPGASCNLEIDFDPLLSSLTANPTYLWENVTLTTNATPGTTTLAMQGTDGKIMPWVRLTSSQNPALTGVPVTLEATFDFVNAQQELTGTVAFSANGTGISGCSAVTPINGVATCTTSFSSAGSQSILASYSGDAYYYNPNSNAYTLSVVVPPAATAPGETTFGTSAAPIAVGGNTTGSVTFTFTSAVTLSQIQALTQGATGLDFSVASGGSCAAGSSYGPSGVTSCTVNITFKPQHPGIRNGAATLSDDSNSVVATAYLQGYSSGVQVAVSPASSLYTNTTTASGLSSWGSVAVDGAGNLFAVGNGINNGSALFEMKPSVVGGALNYSQTQVYSTGTDGTGTNDAIYGVAVDGAGNLYFIDKDQLYLLPRQADGTYPAYTAVVNLGGACVNGVATGSCWNSALGMAVDGAGNIYVADNDRNNRDSAAAIYKMTTSNGVYSAPAALPAPSGGYSNLVGVAVDGAGNVYALNQSSPAAVYESIWSGSSYSTPVAITANNGNSLFDDPEGIAADGLGNLYVADYYWGLLQLVPAGSGYNEITLAYANSDSQVAADASGNVYLTNYSSLSVYSTTTPATLSFDDEAIGSTSSTHSVKVMSTGNAALNISAIQYPTDFIAGSVESQDCTSSSALTQGQSCYLHIEFAPTTGSNTEVQPLAEDVTVTTNATPATVSVPVTGTAVLPTPDETLTASSSPVVTGASFTLTATMTGGTSTATPTGTVKFSIGSTTLCSAAELQNGVATCDFTPSIAGTFEVQGAYSGDSNYASASESVTLSAVNPPDATPSVPVTGAGSQTVGSSDTTVVTINFAASLSSPVTLGAINVLTQGTPNLDFTLASTQAATGACAVNQQYAAGASCTVTVTFTPKFSGPRVGAVVLMDNSSPASVVATAYLSGTGNGPQGVFLPGTISSALDPNPNDLSRPEGVAVDGAGNLYITDANNNAVYKMTLSGGAYSAPAVIAGNNLHFDSPESVAVDGAGNLYVAAIGWNSDPAVYLFTLQADGSYTQTFLGTGWQYPSGVAVDGKGDVYVADNGSDSVVKLTPSNGAYTQATVASSLSNPWGVAVDTSGNVYVANNRANRTAGTVLKLTLAGSSYTQSTLGSDWSDPNGIAADGDGNVYVADNGRGIVAKLTLQSDGSYTQTTLNTGDLDSQEGVAWMAQATSMLSILITPMFTSWMWLIRRR